MRGNTTVERTILGCRVVSRLFGFFHALLSCQTSTPTHTVRALINFSGNHVTLQGLEKYHTTLQSRATLITDTDSLRQQNTELRLLLHQYMHAKVNQELEIPPTLVLPVPVQPPMV